MSEQAQLKVSSHLINDASDYKDVDTYIIEPSGEEWLYRTYLQKDDGEIIKVKPRYAPGKDEDFWDDGIKPAPAHVQAAYEAELPNIMKLIEEGTIVKETLKETVATLRTDRAISGITARDSTLSSDIVFQSGKQILRIKEDGLYFNNRKVDTTQEQDDAFRAFLSGMIGLFPKSRIPLMIETQSAGLRLASDFDAIEIHEMVYDDELGYQPLTQANINEAQYDPDAISVFVHCRSGGTECVADFPFDPSEPGSEEVARKLADALGASVASIIANAHPHLPHSYIMRQRHLDLIEGVLKNG